MDGPNLLIIKLLFVTFHTDEIQPNALIPVQVLGIQRSILLFNNFNIQANIKSYDEKIKHFDFTIHYYLLLLF